MYQLQHSEEDKDTPWLAASAWINSSWDKSDGYPFLSYNAVLSVDRQRTREVLIVQTSAASPRSDDRYGGGQ